MPKYLATFKYSTSVGELIWVEAATREEACERIIVHANNKGCSAPSEMLLWHAAIESLQDEHYVNLDVPIKYADASIRLNVLEEIIRQIASLEPNAPVPLSLVSEAQKVLSDIQD